MFDPYIYNQNVGIAKTSFQSHIPGQQLWQPLFHTLPWSPLPTPVIKNKYKKRSNNTKLAHNFLQI